MAPLTGDELLNKILCVRDHNWEIAIPWDCRDAGIAPEDNVYYLSKEMLKLCMMADQSVFHWADDMNSGEQIVGKARFMWDDNKRLRGVWMRSYFRTPQVQYIPFVPMERAHEEDAQAEDDVDHRGDVEADGVVFAGTAV